MNEPTGQNLPVAPRFAGCLTVIGDLVEDVVVWLEVPVAVGTDNAAIVHRSRGGSAANVAATAAGRAPTRFIGRIGADAAGTALVTELERLGVDVRVQREGRTGTVVAFVDVAAERTMFPDRAAAAQLDDIPAEWLTGTAVVHVPAYGFGSDVTSRAIRAAIGCARGLGGAVSLDTSATSLIEHYGVGEFRSLIDSIRPDLLFANATEAGLLGLDRVAPAPGTAYVIKDGPRAAVVIGHRGEIARVTPDHVAGVKDTTGAGDAFAGGFLPAWMAGTSMEEACIAGHAAAAQVLTVPGAGNGTDTAYSNPVE